MLVKACKGYELMKEKPNTSEDFFNRSEVVYEENGQEKTFQVLYVRFFDELIQEQISFHPESLFQNEDTGVSFKDIVAVCCLLSNPDLRGRKRLYINSIGEFSSYFKEIDLQSLSGLLESLARGKAYHIESPNSLLK